MKTTFKLFLISTLTISSLYSCKKEVLKPLPKEEVWPGGDGGTYNIAVFTKTGTKGVPGTIFIKYGRKNKPADTFSYDKKFQTMVEPGYGPHAHFMALKEGFYFIHANCNNAGTTVTADTVLTIVAGQNTNVDYYINLK